MGYGPKKSGTPKGTRRGENIKGSISSVPGLLPGVNSLKDIYAWVMAKFGSKEVGGGASDLKASLWLEINNPGTDPPTFGPFCNIYIFLATEDLHSIMSKGDTLKEMYYIQKAGIKHPSEASVIYSFKRAVASWWNFFRWYWIRLSFIPSDSQDRFGLGIHSVRRRKLQARSRGHPDQMTIGH
jgi:hypothetical protein